QGAELQDALPQLMAAELIYGRGAPPEASYVFKHALVQDTAYESLLRSRRQQIHHRVAEALRNHFPGQAESEPEIVAQHFTKAALPREALEWWSKAGRRAADRSANIEAIRNFT